MSETERFEAYSPHTWQDGEKIIADNLNNFETYLSTISEDYSDFKYNIYQDIDVIINEAAANVESAIVQNALKKSSESDAERTMTGDFIVKKTTPAILLRNNNDTNVNMARLFQYMQDGTIGRVGIGERYNKNYAEEIYYLPAPDDRQTDVSYQFLTTKSPVSIAQGGTGAMDATQARVNLGVLPLVGGTMTGDLTMEASKIQFKDTNDNATIAIWKNTSQNQLIVSQTGTDSTAPERFWIPAPDTGRTSTVNYEFITTKNLEKAGLEYFAVDAGKTATIDCNGQYCVGLILSSGANNGNRGIFLIYSNSSGVWSSTVYAPSTNYFTISTSGTKLKIKNTSNSAYNYMKYIAINNRMPIITVA